MNIPDYTASRIGLPLTALLGARAAGAPLPKRLRLFRLGTNETSQGPFVVTEETLANLSAVQRKMGRERIAIGWEHNIDPGSEEYKRTNEPRPVAARGATVMAVAGQGIDLVDIDWTDLGSQNIGQYEDLSPTPVYNTNTREVRGLLSASLVRAGAVYGLSLSASEAAAAQLSAILPGESEEELFGHDRLVRAFERENKGRAERESAHLSAAGHPPIDASLTGMGRLVAAFDVENQRNAEYRRTMGLPALH